MQDKIEANKVIIIGEHPKVFICSLRDDKTGLNQIGLDVPILVSLDEYERKYTYGRRPIHLYLTEKEDLRFLLALAQIGIDTSEHDFLRGLFLYEHILREQGIDIAEELRKAAGLSTDQGAIEYLHQLNLRLRRHLENAHQYYANPVQLPGEIGPTRKPQIIPPVNVKWL